MPSLARVSGFPFHPISEINQGDGYALAESFRPDIILSLRFDLIFRAPAIRLARLGALNITPVRCPATRASTRRSAPCWRVSPRRGARCT